MKVNWRQQQQGDIRDIVRGRVQGTQRDRDGGKKCVGKCSSSCRCGLTAKLLNSRNQVGAAMAVSLGTGRRSFIPCCFDFKQSLNE